MVHELLIIAANLSGVAGAERVVSPGVEGAAVSLRVAWAQRVLWPHIFKRRVVEDSKVNEFFIAAISCGIALAVSVVLPVVVVSFREVSSRVLEAAVAALF